jgi:hypothetical protein
MQTYRLGKLLVDEGLLTEADRRTIKRNCGYAGSAFAKSIISLGIMDEQELASFIAEKTRNQMASKNLSTDTQPTAVGAIDIPLLERLEVIPLELRADILKIAMVDPLDQDTISQLEFFTGYKIIPVVATVSQINEALKELLRGYEPSLTSLEEFMHNHATPASKRLKIIQGASVSDSPIPVKPPIAEYEEPLLDEEIEERKTRSAARKPMAAQAAADSSEDLDLGSLDDELAESTPAIEEFEEDSGEDFEVGGDDLEDDDLEDDDLEDDDLEDDDLEDDDLEDDLSGDELDDDDLGDDLSDDELDDDDLGDDLSEDDELDADLSDDTLDEFEEESSDDESEEIEEFEPEPSEADSLNANNDEENAFEDQSADQGSDEIAGLAAATIDSELSDDTGEDIDSLMDDDLNIDLSDDKLASDLSLVSDIDPNMVDLPDMGDFDDDEPSEADSPDDALDDLGDIEEGSSDDALDDLLSNDDISENEEVSDALEEAEEVTDADSPIESIDPLADEQNDRGDDLEDEVTSTEESEVDDLLGDDSDTEGLDDLLGDDSSSDVALAASAEEDSNEEAPADLLADDLNDEISDSPEEAPAEDIDDLLADSPEESADDLGIGELDAPLDSSVEETEPPSEDELKALDADSGADQLDGLDNIEDDASEADLEATSEEGEELDDTLENNLDLEVSEEPSTDETLQEDIEISDDGSAIDDLGDIELEADAPGSDSNEGLSEELSAAPDSDPETTQEMVPIEVDENDLKKVTMHAVGSINKTMLKLSMKTDREAIISEVAAALSDAGISRCLILNVTEELITPMTSWNTETGVVVIEEQGNEKFVTEGIRFAFERLYPGWTTFDHTTREENLAPFADWTDAGEQLAAAMLPNEDSQIAIVVAWDEPHCHSDAIRGASLEIVKRLVKKI